MGVASKLVRTPARRVSSQSTILLPTQQNKRHTIASAFRCLFLPRWCCCNTRQRSAAICFLATFVCFYKMPRTIVLTTDSSNFHRTCSGDQRKESTVFFDRIAMLHVQNPLFRSTRWRNAFLRGPTFLLLAGLRKWFLPRPLAAQRIALQ